MPCCMVLVCTLLVCAPPYFLYPGFWCVTYQCCNIQRVLIVFQEKLDLQDKLADTQADYNTLHSEHEELKQKFEKERQCTGTVGVLFC